MDMKNFKTFEEFVNENSNFDYHINLIKKAEDYLALNGMESVGEIERLVNNYLGDREIRPDDEKLITSLEFFKNRLGEKPNPKSTQLGKYLVKNKLAESVNEKKQLPKEIANHKDIPSWARYVAQHSDGEWAWYEETPTMIRFKSGGGAWKQDGNQTFTGVKTDGKDWDKIPTYYYVKNGKITESFNEPYYTPHKLKNSRLVMKTRDEIEAMIRSGKRHHVEKLLDKVNDIKNKLEEKYNREQEGHNRFNIMDSLSADMTYLRSYAKIINYLLENI